MSREERYPHGCDVDYLNEQVAEAMHAAHCEEHEAYPQKGCQWCEAEEQAEQEAQAENEAAGIPRDFQRRIYATCDAEDAEQEAQRPVCQDCGEKGLPGYVAGDRCARTVVSQRNGVKVECGGRLDSPEPLVPPVVLVKCPQCRALNVKGMYCTGCGWVPVRGEE